jgi:hypothetical protein
MPFLILLVQICTLDSYDFSISKGVEMRQKGIALHKYKYKGNWLIPQLKPTTNIKNISIIL